jgi:hypothetical protein
MTIKKLAGTIGSKLQKRLIPTWKRALSFYSVQAGIIGGGVLTGIAAVSTAGISVPQYWSDAAAFLTITAMVVGRLINQGDDNDST